MELLALGGGLALFSKLLEGDREQPPLASTAAEQGELMLEDQWDYIVHEGRERGIIAPNFGNIATRTPWHTAAAPYYMDLPATGDDHETPAEDIYRKQANTLVHESQDMLEQLERNKLLFPRKRGHPWYTGFTEQMWTQKDGEMVPTNIGPFVFLPRNPHDSDYNYAASVYKAVSADPLLFTPEGNWANAPGLPFRYSNTT